MRPTSRWLLGAASAAMVVALARPIGLPVGDGLADFSTGLAAALMIGILLTHRVREA